MSQVSSGNSLSGKVAIITGAGRGLGAATALKLAAEGADIVVNDISAENASKVAAEIEKLGRRAITSSHDVSDHQKAQALVDETLAKLNRLDILVNNAGITRDSMLHKLAEDKWDEVIRVNLKGPFNMGQACAKAMMERKSGGSMVNLASVAWLGNIGQTNYSAAKAGVVGMTKTWALELARHGIRANAIAPGFIDTPMTQAVPADVKDKFIQKIPLRRMGKPEEIAELIAFLVSDRSSYITGQVVHIDGGLTVGLNAF